ncbi:MAG: hypothetical protein O7H40_04135 [Gammaproteobacteria bacterium]|nr:hypothetical protein [Gammaproteobacteria bacterium]
MSVQDLFRAASIDTLVTVPNPLEDNGMTNRTDSEWTAVCTLVACAIAVTIVVELVLG